MTRVIAIANQKGGSAKTTTALNLGSELALLGRSTLLVDLDPQGHLSEGLGLSAGELTRELSEVLDGKCTLEEIVQPVRPQLDLAPTNIRLSYLEPYLITRARREDRLRHALAPVRERYDFILIDCPPSLGILTVNAFSAAQELLVPMTAEFFALLGVSLLLETVDAMRADLNPDLALVGILPTRVNRTVHARDVIERLHDELGSTVRVFDPGVPETVAVRNAAAAGQPLSDFQPKSPARAAYRQLAEEITA